MTYVFYADIFWLNQFLLHTAILLLTGDLHDSRRGLQHHSDIYARFHAKPHITAQKTDSMASESSKSWISYHIRYLAASAIGSTCGTAVLLLTHSYYIYLAMAVLITLPLMVLLAFGRCDPALFRKRYAGCFAIAILLGGLVTALENIASIAQVPFLSALIAFLLAEKWIRSLMRHRQIRRLLYPVILRHGKREVPMTGLLDTGNLLLDPCSGRPVHLLRASKLESCGITEKDFLGLVPYQALGNNDGLLAIYRVEGLRILHECAENGIASADSATFSPTGDADERSCTAVVDECSCNADADECSYNADAGKCFRPAVIAAAPEELFYGKEYDAILNSASIVS